MKKSIIAALALILSVGSAAQAQTTQKTSHRNAHKELLAKQGTGSNINMSTENFIKLMEEEEPEPDIYTEGWNSRSVNPFKDADVPQTATLNVTGYHSPVPGKVTSPYGYRARFGRMHKGVDIPLRSNDTVYAAFSGKVRLTNYEPKGYGNYVIMRHGNKLETVYGHLNKILVKRDQYVQAGQPIGLGGSTGRSTGPHLHFETRFMGYAINPEGIINFNNGTVHTDQYVFSKNTYQQARSFGPANKEVASAQTEQPKQSRYQKASASVATYTVKAGDSLASIAKSYGISTTTLRRLNSMNSADKIHVGQVLKVK